MASHCAYAVVPIDGLKPSDRRGIVFLVREDDDGLDAARTFKAFASKQEREVRNRFDYWIGGGVCDRYFHGWPNRAEYKQCFVFKWTDRKGNHRFYGFLCHPQPRTNPRFQLCVIASHAIKRRWSTDPRELDGTNALRVCLEVMAAIRGSFPERKTGEHDG
jgi:hypothetical protein